MIRQIFNIHISLYNYLQLIKILLHNSNRNYSKHSALNIFFIEIFHFWFKKVNVFIHFKNLIREILEWFKWKITLKVSALFAYFICASFSLVIFTVYNLPCDFKEISREKIETYFEFFEDELIISLLLLNIFIYKRKI